MRVWYLTTGAADGPPVPWRDSPQALRVAADILLAVDAGAGIQRCDLGIGTRLGPEMPWPDDDDAHVWRLDPFGATPW